jgi:PAS domain S-box-containing protein
MNIETLLADAPIMIAVIEGPDHILKVANKSYLDALGATEDVIGRPVQEAFADLYKQHSDRLIEKVRLSGESHIEHERHLRLRRHGELVDVYFNFAFQPLKDKNGTVASVCLYGMEVTPQVATRRKYRHDKQRQLDAQTAQLRRQNDELKELNTSKDEFIALASHQLRTPATGVKQYLGMILEGYAGEVLPTQEEFLRQAYRSNERQLNTINDLLQIAQINAGKIILNTQECDVVPLVKAVADEQQSNLKRRRQTISFSMPHAAVVWADPLRMRMVLDNLVDNASKYSHEHTHIVITVRVLGDTVEISVADQGVGIDEADFAKLFQKFSRIDNPLSLVVGGNGLGLYMVKKLVDAHGGTIEVASAVGSGTTFTLQLPTPPDAPKI